MRKARDTINNSFSNETISDKFLKNYYYKRDKASQAFESAKHYKYTNPQIEIDNSIDSNEFDVMEFITNMGMYGIVNRLLKGALNSIVKRYYIVHTEEIETFVVKSIVNPKHSKNIVLSKPSLLVCADYKKPIEDMRFYQLVTRRIKIVNDNDMFGVLPNKSLFINRLNKYNFMITRVISTASLHHAGSQALYKFVYLIIGNNPRKMFDNIVKFRRKLTDGRIREKYVKKSIQLYSKLYGMTFNNKDKDRFTNLYNGQYTFPTKNIDNMILHNHGIEYLKRSTKLFIKNSETLLNKYGAKSMFGILLYGPPGTGKTSIAHSLAWYLNARIIMLSPETILGSTNNAFHTGSDDESFDCKDIILLDEIDMFIGYTDGNRTITKDMFLRFIDGLSGIVIATTNNIESLDQSLIRAGRFDIKMEIPFFDKPEAIKMIKTYDLPESFADKFDYPIMPAELQYACLDHIRNIMSEEVCLNNAEKKINDEN